MFSKILVANRGEIAVRIIRACKEMGIATVAVFSQADRESLHASLADESYCIGGPHVKDSYLNMFAILTIASLSGAEAIHPGYGLLSENPRFARMCEESGIVFIGPSGSVIEQLGDKDTARKTMAAAGVPVIPGCDAAEEDELLRHAERIGFPLLIKARAGGGGRGIRLVSEKRNFSAQLAAAKAEAHAAFGDGGVYLEKYLDPVKHVEVQLLCDRFGQIVALGDRDCSVQRKNQKLIEEAPAPTLPQTVREQMLSAAKKAAEVTGYTGAGTVEFLLDGDHRFYFMEMNTRLQVEHSVTEMATGIDIVKWQIRIAANLPLTFTQEDARIDGCAIECRINAEHPIDFTPNAGEIKLLHIPGGPNVRFDSAVYQNYVVPPYYDSLLGKLIVYSKTREEAIRKMRSALAELVIEGLYHNSELHLEILSDPQFIDGSYSTKFLTEKGYFAK